MRFTIHDLRFAICGLAIAVSLTSATGADANQAPYAIDLPTALRLAGAQNLDIQLASEKLNEARANYDNSVLQFFPWLSPGISYRRHDDLIQDTTGNIVQVNKQSYAPGFTIGSQLDLGDTIYKRLVAKQLVKVADHALEAQRQNAVLAAAQGYFDLALAQSGIEVARESVRISTIYEAQIEHAVKAGTMFKGDHLRVKVQSDRNRLALRQTIEQQRIAGARLAQFLHLDPSVELVARDTVLAPLNLVETNSALAPLILHALAARPEIKLSQAQIEAAQAAKDGAVYGPLIPTVGAQAFLGGLGGGKNGDLGNFGGQEDYFFGLSWRIGPGGIFDSTRKRSTEARLKSAQISREKINDEISRQVVEAFARLQSQNDQISIAREALASAEESLRLAQARRKLEVGMVLENILAEQDLTRVRQDYLKAVAEFNKAQYSLARATGTLAGNTTPISTATAEKE